MKIHFQYKNLALLGAFCFALPVSLAAHRMWIVPSSTVISGTDQWIAVDAAISNDLFFANHHGMRPEGIAVIGPDGKEVEKQNVSVGKIRSTFDVQLVQEGTYRIQQVRDMYFASWTEGGEPQRWRGDREGLKGLDLTGKEGFRAQQRSSRVETVVTAGQPTTGVFEPTGEGLELVPITHPNDLFAGEAARFKLFLGGVPYVGATVTLIPGQDRYRDRVEEIKVTTNDAGIFEVTWPKPGLYWLEAEGEIGEVKSDDSFSVTASASYSAVFEVLPF